MAISGAGSYVNAYENLYTNTTSAVRAEDVEKSSNEEYLKSLQKQVPYIKLQIGYGLNTNKDNKVNVVNVNPKLLGKMQNDSEAAKEYTQRLKNVEAATKWVDGWEKAMGYTAIVRHGYVDENGNFSNFAVVVRKDESNEILRKEAQENAEKQIEKTRENARQKKEEIEENLEEKAEDAVEADGKTSICEGANITKNRAEKLLSEKMGNVNDGKVNLNEERTTTKQSIRVGENFDFKI